MLPSSVSSWVGDLANLLALLTALITGLGWLLSRLIPRNPDRQAGPPRRARNDAPRPQPTSRDRFTVGGHLRSFVLQMLLRPDVPLGMDVLRIAGGTFGLIVAATLWVWNQATLQAPSTFPALPLLQTLAFYALIALALMLVLLVARLFWKISYLRRLHDEDDYDDR